MKKKEIKRNSSGKMRKKENETKQENRGIKEKRYMNFKRKGRRTRKSNK